MGFMVYRDPAALLSDWERWHARLLAQRDAAATEADRVEAELEIAQHDAQREASE